MGADAFTLLEVMVAVALLAVTLTAVFSSQVGAVKVDQRARMTAIATNLVRCKMGEIEERVAKDGLPAVYAEGTDACCKNLGVEGFTCEWKIERIVLPDMTQMSSAQPMDVLNKSSGKSGDANKGEDEDSKEPMSLKSFATSGVPGDLVSQMAMQYAFPILKPFVEEQVRRAVVKVNWLEGTKKKSFDVMQYITSERNAVIQNPSALPQAAPGKSGQASGATGAPSPSSPALKSPFGGSR